MADITDTAAGFEHLSREPTLEPQGITDGEWPSSLTEKYDITGYRHARSILMHDFPDIYRDLVGILGRFSFPYSHVILGSDRNRSIAADFDCQLAKSGFTEKKVDIAQIIDGKRYESPIHKVDFFKERVAVELEWNNKTEFYDRDLDNFRKLHALGVLSIGVIVTRATSLDNTFLVIDRLLAEMPYEYTRRDGRREHITSISAKYGASTTNTDRLYPKIEGGAGGQCPLLVFAMKGPAARDNYSEAMERARAIGRQVVIPEDLINTGGITSEDLELLTNPE
jgi:hypothetical protein